VKTKNLTIADKAQVTLIVSGPDGKVTCVTYIRDGMEYFQPARVVLLGSYTYENSRLLLLSAMGVEMEGVRARERRALGFTLYTVEYFSL
jgi:gluconate 2-dehydrogenase alpha chain